MFKHATERVICNELTDIDYTDPYPTDNQWGVNENYVPSLKAREINMDKSLVVELILSLKAELIFLRHSFFHFYDKNFSATNVKGTESTVELKINF